MRFLIVLLSLIMIPARADVVQIDNVLNKQKMPEVLIFISFSMPKDSIKVWLEQAAKIDAPVIIRGLINNSFKETAKAMADLVKDNQGGVQLDPTLFKKYKIEKVPAVVVAETNDCVLNQTCIDTYDVIYGNVTLDYALQKIADEEDVLSPIAKANLQKLKGLQHA